MSSPPRTLHRLGALLRPRQTRNNPSSFYKRMSAEFSAAAATTATTMAAKAPVNAFSTPQNNEPSSLSSLTFSVKPTQDDPVHLQEVRNHTAHRKSNSCQSDCINSGSVDFSEAFFATSKSSEILNMTSQHQSGQQQRRGSLLDASQLSARMSQTRKRSIRKNWKVIARR